MAGLFQTPVRPDWEGFLKCVTRSGMPERVHHIELFIDPEVQDAVCARFGLEEGLDRADPHFALRRRAVLPRRAPRPRDDAGGV